MGSNNATRNNYNGPTFVFHHAQLGNLKGRLVESSHFPGHTVVQFRSIPYAIVPQRFSPSILLTEIPGDYDARPLRDFTDYGAACPQNASSNPARYDAYGGPLLDEHLMNFNEFACLNLSISVPLSHLTSEDVSKSCPVMVYIHGGGAAEGTGHVDELHSNSHLTAFSSSILKPVITVNIGYRLNWFGGLVCQDLLDEGKELGSISEYGPFNLNIQDQRNAFKWIHKFIAAFGGNVNNITAFGESAGSVFLVYHICGSTKRLFDRAILQSGLVFGDLSMVEKELEYQNLLRLCNITGNTARDRLDALRRIDENELVQVMGSFMTPFVRPIPDYDTTSSLFARGPVTLMSQIHLLSTCEWLGDLVLGDTFWEGNIVFPLLRAVTPSTIVDITKSIFPEREASNLLAAYDLSISEQMDPNRAWMQLSIFLGDVMFSAETHRLCHTILSNNEYRTRRKIFRYSFALSNPFPGSTLSFNPGHHFVEILFIFLSLLDRYPTKRNNWTKQQACETARRWITFANGDDPWEAFSDPQQIMSEQDSKIAICDDIAGWSTRTLEEDRILSKNDPWGDRRYDAWKAYLIAIESLREGCDEVAFDEKVNAAKAALLYPAYGPLGVVRLTKHSG